MSFVAETSLESLPEHVAVAEKRLVNADLVAVNQLMPLKYHWAWEHYLNGCRNHWLPQEVPMDRDIALWKRPDGLTEDERTVVLRNLGFFSTAESLVGNNLVLGVFKHVTNPECRQYLLRQAFEEAIHTHAFHYIVESLGLDGHEVFTMHRTVNTIHDKDGFTMRLTEALCDPDFRTDSTGGIQKFVENLVGYYVVMEGIFFYSGFAMMLGFHRQNRMTGVGEQFQYILRDESTHLNFGIDLINGIRTENPEIWTPDLRERLNSMIDEAVEREIAYAVDCLPRGVLGLNADQFRDYVRHIADRRLERIGLPARYAAQNPFPWMSETIDLKKEKNFFETRVTEYQSGGALSWD
ncbi:MAG: ribonucleotide-diphosphate reductase subunit beta [Pirellulales bacterium]